MRTITLVKEIQALKIKSLNLLFDPIRLRKYKQNKEIPKRFEKIPIMVFFEFKAKQREYNPTNNNVKMKFFGIFIRRIEKTIIAKLSGKRMYANLKSMSVLKMGTLATNDSEKTMIRLLINK